jgi:hypothetical protein
MTTNDAVLRQIAEYVKLDTATIQVAGNTVVPLPDLPLIPQVPATGPKRVPTLRQYAVRIVQRLGAPAALMLAAELDDAVAEMETGKW